MESTKLMKIALTDIRATNTDWTVKSVLNRKNRQIKGNLKKQIGTYTFTL